MRKQITLICFRPKYSANFIGIYERNAKYFIRYKNTPQYCTLWLLYKLIHNMYINIIICSIISYFILLTNVLKSQIPLFSVERIRVVFKVNKWICFCIQNFTRHKAPQFKSQRCHDKHKRSRIKKPFQFTILSKTPTCKTAVSTSADLDIAVVEHPHLLISPSASG